MIFDPEMTLETAISVGVSGTGLDSGQQTAAQSHSQQRIGPRGHIDEGHIGIGENRPYAPISVGTGSFSNPAMRQGAFAQAMSQISCNPSSAAQGSVLSAKDLGNKLFNQIQLALALKMGLNGPQQVKERALHNVLTDKSARGDMKQVLQSRAEIYNDALDPNWFQANVDLGGKAKSLRQKNQARSQLAGAPLLVAQLGALEFRKWLMAGDPTGLSRIRLGTQATMAEFIKQLGRASPLAVLKLCFGTDKYDFPDCLLQLADDLDFTQDTLNAAGESLELNPVLNGVLAGFNRRRRYSRFKYGHHTLELDRLWFAHTVSEKDSDLFATEVKKNRKAGKSTGFTTLCTFFQRAGGCSQNNLSFFPQVLDMQQAEPCGGGLF